MSLALIVAAALAAAPEALPSGPKSRASVQVDRSIDDSKRLDELDIAIRAALARREIDEASAESLHLSVARTRRQMFRMGMQVGYRQRVRMRERIDRLYTLLETRRAPISAERPSGK